MDVKEPGRIKKLQQVAVSSQFQPPYNFLLLPVSAITPPSLDSDGIDGVLYRTPGHFRSLEVSILAKQPFNSQR